MKKIALAAIGLTLAGWSAPVAAADRQRGVARGHATPPPEAPLLGLVVYDTGVNAGFHPDTPNAPQHRIVGNRFDSALGDPLLMTGMVTRMTVFPANTGPQSVSLFAAPNSMNSAMALGFETVAMTANQFNSVLMTPPITVGSDFLGMFLGTFGTFHAAGLLGMSDMATMGQGYHAVQAFYMGQVARSIEVVPNRNGMIRARGDIRIPVELMDFRIE